MKLLVFSDSHGCTTGMDIAIRNTPVIDAIVFCGDIARDADYLRDVYSPIPLYAVCGNNDFYSQYPYQMTVPFSGVQTYITHGHFEHVKYGTSALAEQCRMNDCALCFFGHTHRPMIVDVGGLTLVNPGSIRSTVSGTFSVVTIENGNVTVVNRRISDFN